MLTIEVGVAIGFAPSWFTWQSAKARRLIDTIRRRCSRPSTTDPGWLRVAFLWYGPSQVGHWLKFNATFFAFLNIATDHRWLSTVT